MTSPTFLLLTPALLLAACVGEDRLTTHSPPQSSRSFATGTSRDSVSGPPARADRYSAGRVYLVTRTGTADQPRGEWRTLGESIRESGTRIQFTELGSGKTVEFDAPHQITPTGSQRDPARATLQYTSEGGPPPADNARGGPGTPGRQSGYP